MRRILLVFVALTATMLASADNYLNQEPLKLEVPEMKAELSTPAELTFDSPATVSPEKKKWRPDFDFFKSKTNPGVKPYKFMDDMTFVGVPLFVAGLAIKGDKAMFRVNNKNGKQNTQLLTGFKTGIDDYTQFFGPAMVVGLKLGGYEGRSDWPRLLASSLMSYAIMAGLVNGIKYTAKEMRPDGSTANSWPSGHTATAFVGATLLHKEYGLTRSPWWSVAGYGVATATGVMRVLNNRHWVSDVMSGAGIGILSGELGYALCDLLFRGKGLLRNDLVFNSEKPSFFSISMGAGLGSKDLDFESNGREANIKFRAATVVDAEGAYFFNKYIGVGGRFRVRGMSAKSFGQYADISTEDGSATWAMMVGSVYEEADETLNMAAAMQGGAPVTVSSGIVQSDHLAEFTASAGLYLNIPLSKHFSLGTKLLLGRSFTQELDIDGYVEGNVKDINYDIWMRDGKVYKDPDTGIPAFFLNDPVNTGERYVDQWDYLTLGASSSTSWGTGISLTYRYKSNFSWKLFCDYDYTEKDFTMTVNPLHYMQKALTPNAYGLISNPMVSPYHAMLDPIVYKKKKNMNYFTIGLSFLVNL